MTEIPTKPEHVPLAEITPERRAPAAIRTMKSDAAKLITEQAPRATSVPAAPSSASPKLNVRSITSGKLVSFLIYFLMGTVIAVVSLVSVSVFFSPGQQTPPNAIEPPAPLFGTEHGRIITGTSKIPAEISRLLEETSKEVERDGTMKRVNIKLTDTGKERFATVADFFDIFTIVPPARFLDRLNKPIMLFFRYAGGESRFGIAVETRDPDRTLADMLAWEPSLFANFRTFFFGQLPQDIQVPFEDRIYRNIDWRYLKLSQEKDLGIAYMIFPAKNLLVITTSKDTITATIDRLFENQ